MVSDILKYKEQTEKFEYTKTLLRAAEQRINFVYMMLMIAFEATILIYILFNAWDDTRFVFGGIAGSVLFFGIVMNAFIHKKNYPWNKYVNTLLIIAAVLVLCRLSEYIVFVFYLLPLISSFYFRPRFSLLTGIICMIMTYIGFMSIMVPIYDANNNIEVDMFKFVISTFDYSEEASVIILSGRSFLLFLSAILVALSVYLSVSGRRFTLRQGELMYKNLTTSAELNVARSIQEGFLSTDFPDNRSYAVYADMKAATEVGGDFYDFFLIDETHLAVVIGDVSGHGTPAAMFMTLVKTLIKVYAQSKLSADKIFDKTNRYLQKSNPAKLFVTGWIGILDLSSGILSYANAGHNYPVIIRGGKEPVFLTSKPNFVLGIRRLIRYKENRTKLRPGDKLILYTDGVTEAKAPDESFFENERLLKVIGEVADKNQNEIIDAVRSAVDRFENGNSPLDDSTLLTLCFKDYLQEEPPESKTFFLTKETFDEIRNYILERSAAEGCDEKTLDKINLASSEILANIDSYAYENGGEIEILTKCRDHRMTIVFKDDGKPFNPLLEREPDVTLPLSQRAPGGLGIFIVNKVMSETNYAYKGGKNVLTVEIDF